MEAAIFSQPATVISAAGNTGYIPVESYTTLGFAANISAIDGSTTLVFTIYNLGADGVDYPLWTSGNITATGTVEQSIGSGMETARIFGEMVKVAWTITSAKTATVSLSLEGR